MAEKPVTSVNEFLDRILSVEKPNIQLAYRGHSDPKYKLIARVFRDKSAKLNEEKILSELLTEAPTEFQNDNSVFEQLVRAQHYGLPTRLLDVTLNPLAALYFAVREGDADPFAKPAEVIRFKISSDRVKLFDSDTLSCIANVARLSYEEKNKIYALFTGMKGSGGVSAIDTQEFNSRLEVKRLVQFVRVEKPYFQPEINPIDLYRFVFAIPRKLNKRLSAQAGAFIASGLMKNVTEEGSRALEYDRIQINSGFKDVIKSELDLLHINERTLFPEIEKATEYISSKYSDESK